MITVWISASLLALTGWQGYRLGKEYGWWGRGPAPKPVVTDEDEAAPGESVTGGLGQSKTDFARLLSGYQPVKTTGPVPVEEKTPEPMLDDSPVTEAATTLTQLDEQDYPAETDLVPDSCNWLDEESILLLDEDVPVDTTAEPVVLLNDYVKRVRTVQRKMTQLTRRRAADTSFMKQELGILIDTYQLENDLSLDWLFGQHTRPDQPDYGALFDRIENLCG